MFETRNAKPTIIMLIMLMAFLLCSQTWGLMHRVAHAKQSVGLTTQTVADNAHTGHSHWGDHSTASECRVFDQSCPDLLAFSNCHIAQAVTVPLWVTTLLIERFALFERFYLAQGPPAALK